MNEHIIEPPLVPIHETNLPESIEDEPCVREIETWLFRQKLKRDDLIVTLHAEFVRIIRTNVIGSAEGKLSQRIVCWTTNNGEDIHISVGWVEAP